MPSRLSIKTLPTPEIQGDDSYIKYRPVTIEEARELRTKVTEVQNLQNKALTEYAVSQNKAVADLTDEEKETAYETSGLTDDLLSFADKQLSKFILEWNWVDDDGNPLPQPKDDYKVMGKLYTHEYSFIMSLFNPDENRAKN
jgi:hypothetical protein